MIQTSLLKGVVEKRWQPAVPPCRPRRLVGIIVRKPLPGQMLLPGMETLNQTDTIVHRALAEEIA